MKSVFIDTNILNENGSVQIHEVIARALDLENGETVIAYQEDEFWEANVVKEKNSWGVQLVTEAGTVSSERLEGQKEGFREGLFVQMLRVIKVLQSQGYSDEEIEKIKECMQK